MKMKGIPYYGILVVLSIVLLCSCKVHAVDTYMVSTDESYIEKIDDKTYSIPIYLTGNKGIMGFRLRLTNEDENGEIIAVSKGLVTQKGSFQTDLNPLSDHKTVDVLWNNTENSSIDGSLLFVMYKVKDQKTSTVNIDLEYVQEDTFDVNYKDVVLQCQSVKGNLLREQTDSEVSFPSSVDKEKEQDLVEQQRDNYSKESLPFQEGDVKEAVITALNKYNYRSLNDVEPKREKTFWRDVKSVLEEKTKSKKYKITAEEVKETAEQLSISSSDFEKFDTELGEKTQTQKFSKNYIGYVGLFSIVLLLFVVAMIWRRMRIEKK